MRSVLITDKKNESMPVWAPWRFDWLCYGFEEPEEKVIAERKKSSVEEEASPEEFPLTVAPEIRDPMSVTSLFITTELADYEFIREMKNLKHLYIYNGGMIDDLSFLEPLVFLKRLCILCCNVCTRGELERLFLNKREAYASELSSVSGEESEILKDRYGFDCIAIHSYGEALEMRSFNNYGVGCLDMRVNDRRRSLEWCDELFKVYKGYTYDLRHVVEIPGYDAYVLEPYGMRAKRNLLDKLDLGMGRLLPLQEESRLVLIRRGEEGEDPTVSFHDLPLQKDPLDLQKFLRDMDISCHPITEYDETSGGDLFPAWMASLGRAYSLFSEAGYARQELYAMNEEWISNFLVHIYKHDWFCDDCGDILGVVVRDAEEEMIRDLDKYLRILLSRRVEFSYGCWEEICKKEGFWMSDFEWIMR